jgi:hypothetical protein
MWLLAGLPTAIVAGYLLRSGWVGFAHNVSALRPWTMEQRLLTEPRVLMNYLDLLWLPRPFTTGLFNDQYVASVSLLHPATTLPSIVAVLALISGAWWLRRKHPALGLAVLFYFVGQLLESTSLPLELYFEHRNYVPALLMFWPLGLWLTDTRTLKTLTYGLMLVLPLGLALMTHARAEVWGDVQTQALIWARINPYSPRAQANAAQVEMQTGHPQDAVRRLQTLLIAQPDQAQLAFNLIGARCMTGGISPIDIDAAGTAMRNSPNTGSLFVHWFERTLPVAMSGDCPGFAPADLVTLINAGLQNSKQTTAGSRQDLLYLRGRVALAQHHPDAALTDFVRALDLQVRPGMALEAAATLGAAGYPAQGLRLLDHYQQVQSHAVPPDFGMPMLHERVLARENYWPRELARLRHQLSLDVKARSTNTAQSNHDQNTVH